MPSLARRPLDPLDRALAVASRRVLCRRLLAALTVALLVGATAVAVLGWLRSQAGAPPVSGWLTLLWLGAAAASALLVSLACRPSRAELACLLDRQAATADRFRTALELLRQPQRSAMESLAVDDARRFSSQIAWSRVLPIAVPRAAFLLVLPCAALLAIQLAYDSRRRATAEERGIASSILDQASHSVEQSQPAAPDPKLEELARSLLADSKALDQSARNDAREAALRSLAAATEAVRSLERAQSNAAGGDAQSREPNAGSPKTENPAPAGRSAAQAGENEKGNPDETLRQAESLARDRTATPEESAARGVTGAQSQPSQGSSLSRQELRRLAAQLESLKDQLGQPSPGKGGQPPPGGQQTLGAARRSQGNEPPSSSPANGEQPSGSPGSEYDLGTAPISTAAGVAAGTGGPEDSVKLPESEGAALSTVVTSADAPSRSNVAYRQLYEAASPAAQDTVLREDIPIGSRALIKRYFDSIRPAE